MPSEAGQDPDQVRDAVVTFLKEHPDGGATLKALIDVESERETWSFDDVPADSGVFGELVSRGIVERVGDSYRLADRAAVEAGLAGESVSTLHEDASLFDGLDISFDPRTTVGLVGALAFLFVMRVTAYRSVIRGDRVVSPGNDPYYYRYWLDELLAESSGPTDWNVIATMPGEASRTRPLTHATNWWLTELLGGSEWAAAQVAAWAPVLGALALGAVIYKLAVLLTDDPRVGIASVFMLATVPAHAVYSGIGFLDHHFYQYFWLGVTVLALAWLAVDVQRRRHGKQPEAAVQEHLLNGRTWIIAVGLGIAVGMSAHVWGGSPLVFVPLGLYVWLRTIIDGRANVPPLRSNLPILLALGLGSMIAHLFHSRWGWHESFAAYAPALMFVAAIGVVVLSTLWRRTEQSFARLVGVESVLGIAGALALWILRPEMITRVSERAGDLFFRSGMTEAHSLYAAEYGFVFGPMTQTGLVFYLALGPLAWATLVAYRRYEPRWLLIAVYTWYFALLAGIQMRFTGQLSMFIAVLGGLGVVYLLSSVDLARVPAPFADSDHDPQPVGSDHRPHNTHPAIVLPDERAKLAYLVGIFVLVAGLGMLLVPSLVGQITYSVAEYETATAIAEHEEDIDREYPENYVLSDWERNRMYNYFVSAKAQRYEFARQHYTQFLADGNPDSKYGKTERPIGYVVVETPSESGLTPSNEVSADLRRGFNADHVPSTSHYRAIHIDRSGGIAAFATVPGATITGTADPGETVTVTTNTTVSGTSFTYERRATVGENGEFTVTVAYPGKYTVSGDTVEVNERAVYDGRTVEK
jgi:dolichyl-diphosphooligosaccharide--protein glycosyltransferase